MDSKPVVFEGWGIEIDVAACSACKWIFAFPKDQSPQRCPHCFQEGLEKKVGDPAGMPNMRPPEMVVPFQISGPSLAKGVENFASDIWFAPDDLTPANLQKRLQRFYLPSWLVDVQVEADWQAEAGFNYEVVSHQETYDENRGGWSTREVKEDRIRWEPRQGRYHRAIHNIPAPALEGRWRVLDQLGDCAPGATQPYHPGHLKTGGVRLPDRQPEDAWTSALPRIQAQAAEECRRACGADHIRSFIWKPTFTSQNWTLQLFPVLSTYYLDDERCPQPVWINGVSGKVVGQRRASVKRGKQAALGLLGAGVVSFIFSLLLGAASFVVPVSLAAATFFLAVALILGLTAIVPIALVRWADRDQSAFDT